VQYYEIAANPFYVEWVKSELLNVCVAEAEGVAALDADAARGHVGGARRAAAGGPEGLLRPVRPLLRVPVRRPRRPAALPDAQPALPGQGPAADRLRRRAPPARQPGAVRRSASPKRGGYLPCFIPTYYALFFCCC